MSQGGAEGDFEKLWEMNEALDFVRKTIAQRFGAEQLIHTADCIEFLLRGLTSLEQKKVFNDVLNRLFFDKGREKRILLAFKKFEEGKSNEVQGV